MVEDGIEAIISTASGCGVTVKDYGELLKDDPDYAEKAREIAKLTVDISEVIGNEMQSRHPLRNFGRNIKVAFHSPCTLQHGQKITGKIEALLKEYGFNLLPVSDSHLCCGSAGTYSVLQPDLSEQLKADKLGNLQAHAAGRDRNCERGLSTSLTKGFKRAGSALD